MKFIQVDEDAYERLMRLRRTGETVGDLVLRLTLGRQGQRGPRRPD